MELQKKIDMVIRQRQSDTPPDPGTVITLTEEDLTHPMFGKLIYIDIDSVEYFEGNSKTIRSKVESIIQDYQPDLFRPIVVCAIENAVVNIVDDQYVIEKGRVIAADGHHRKSVWTALGMTRIPAFVRTDLKTPDEVVDFYVRLNTSLESEKKTKKNIFDSAKKIVGTTDWTIDRITRKYGKEVDSINEKNVLACIETLRNIVRKYGEWIFDRTIYVLTKAFRGDQDSLKCVVVTNVANYLHKHSSSIEDPGWIDAYIGELQKLPAREWKKRWTPTTEFIRIDNKKFEENIRARRCCSPKWTKKAQA